MIRRHYRLLEEILSLCGREDWIASTPTPSQVTCKTCLRIMARGLYRTEPLEQAKAGT